MIELHRTKYFVVTRIPGSLLIEVRRTSEPFGSLDEMRSEFERVNAILDSAGRISANLIVDTRDAPPRNDPAFELAFQPIRSAMLSGFRRVAILVKTTAGRLQVERHLRLDGVEGRVFVDEVDARTYCTRTR
jgi:hypothetical protein